MRIKNISVKEIPDSRGEPTIEVNLTGENGDTASAQIPSGKSRGRNEAAALKPREAKDTLERIIRPNITGRNFETIGELDSSLITLDGTSRKEILGGNLILGISLAFTRLAAQARKKELWQILNEEFFDGEVGENKPLIFSNLINGGAHAKNNLDIQEYMVVVKTKNSCKESIKKLKDFYAGLGDFLKKEFNIDELNFGDEGGYSLKFPGNFEPVSVLAKLIRKSGLAADFSLALDAAANNFYDKRRYNFGGDSLAAAQMAGIYKTYFGAEPLLISIEDPFAESDFAGFKKLQSAIGDKLVVGDDLTTTDPASINKAVRKKLISGVIIKPNQIGTVTETCEAMKVAHVNGIKTILSHRSGEVEDPFIVHFAKAGGAYGVKIGAPVPSRLSKYNELERIYDSG